MNKFKMIGLPLVAVASMSALSTTAHAADPESLAIGRCDIPRSTSLFERTPERLPASWVIETRGASHGSALPSVMVDGWPAKKAPADVLLRELMDEAGFSYAGSQALPMVDWDGRTASFEEVVSGLVSQFEGHWTFDGSRLSVSPTVPVTSSTASVPLPSDRDVRLATVDVLRAYDLDVSIGSSSISLVGSREELDKARKALAEAKSITVLDVIFLRGRPSDGRYDWNALGAVKSSPNGAGGNFVFTDPEPESLIKRLVARGDLVEDSAQSVAAPEGWGHAVPPEQCGAGNGEIVVTTKKSSDKLDLTVEGSMMDAQFPGFVLGSTAASVSPVPQGGWIKMVLVRPRVVSFSTR